jgi:hypothetical protein
MSERAHTEADLLRLEVKRLEHQRADLIASYEARIAALEARPTSSPPRRGPLPAEAIHGYNQLHDEDFYAAIDADVAAVRAAATALLTPDDDALPGGE